MYLNRVQWLIHLDETGPLMHVKQDELVGMWGLDGHLLFCLGSMGLCRLNKSIGLE